MRILFLIGYFNKNNGGHFHSLHHISNEMAIKNEVQIVSLGSPIETVVNTNKNFHEHIDFKGYNIIHYRLKMASILNNFKPEIVHFFDQHTYNLFKLFFQSFPAKLFMNVCGGPNPKQFVKIENLILFSIENKKWFESQPKFSKTNIHLIPNRVHKIHLSVDRQIIKKDSVFSFVRISRIGNYYKRSLLASIHMINKLNSNGSLCRLYIIGFIEDAETYQELQKAVSSGVDVQFLTDKIYTNEASQMLYLADAVIATGRSIMEACSLSLPVLTPLQNFETPVVVTESNFHELFATNFSERNILDHLNGNLVYENIGKLILDTQFRNSCKKVSYGFFDKYFDVRNVPIYYTEMYRKSSTNNFKWSFLSDFYSVLLSFYKFTTLYKKSYNA